MINNKWKPGVSDYTYDVNGQELGAIDEIGLTSFNCISNSQCQVMLRYAEDCTVGDDKNDHIEQLAKPSHASNR